MNDTVELRITILGVDDEDTADAVVSLRDELAELPVERVRPASAGNAPAGTRSGELVELGTTLVGLAANPEVLAAVLGAISAWLGRRRRGRLEVQLGGDKLVLDDASPEQRQQIVDAFVNRALRH